MKPSPTRVARRFLAAIDAQPLRLQLDYGEKPDATGPGMDSHSMLPGDEDEEEDLGDPEEWVRADEDEE